MYVLNLYLCEIPQYTFTSAILYFLSRQGLPIIRWSIRTLEGCIYLMWGRPHCSSLQGESEIETQHLRTHTGKKKQQRYCQNLTEKLKLQLPLASVWRQSTKHANYGSGKIGLCSDSCHLHASSHWEMINENPALKGCSSTLHPFWTYFLFT